jgi:tetratricopeptide (TPR) repeat protein
VAEIQERQEKYADALATLGRIAEEREGTAAAANALLESAQIQQEHLDDPKGALAVYERIENDPVLGHHRPQMLLQMADCYVRLGDFENASRKYREVIPEAMDPEHAELASLELAEVEFFRGDPDSALVLYQDMAEGHPRSLYTDQAADRYITLNRYHQSDPEGVVLWGKLEWARHVADSTAVETSAQALLRDRPTGELAVDALLALAESAEAGGNLQGALGYLGRLVEENPEARKAPEALMRMGHILAERLGRPQEALQRYESVLTDYPTSVQAGDARRLVEALRSDLKS